MKVLFYKNKYLILLLIISSQFYLLNNNLFLDVEDHVQNISFINKDLLAPLFSWIDNITLVERGSTFTQAFNFLFFFENILKNQLFTIFGFGRSQIFFYSSLVILGNFCLFYFLYEISKNKLLSFVLTLFYFVNFSFEGIKLSEYKVYFYCLFPIFSYLIICFFNSQKIKKLFILFFYFFLLTFVNFFNNPAAVIIFNFCFLIMIIFLHYTNKKKIILKECFKFFYLPMILKTVFFFILFYQSLDINNFTQLADKQPNLNISRIFSPFDSLKGFGAWWITEGYEGALYSPVGYKLFNSNFYNIISLVPILIVGYLLLKQKYRSGHSYICLLISLLTYLIISDFGIIPNLFSFVRYEFYYLGLFRETWGKINYFANIFLCLSLAYALSNKHKKFIYLILVVVIIKFLFHLNYNIQLNIEKKKNKIPESYEKVISFFKDKKNISILKVPINNIPYKNTNLTSPTKYDLMYYGFNSLLKKNNLAIGILFSPLNLYYENIKDMDDILRLILLKKHLNYFHYIILEKKYLEDTIYENQQSLPVLITQIDILKNYDEIINLKEIIIYKNKDFKEKNFIFSLTNRIVKDEILMFSNFSNIKKNLAFIEDKITYDNFLDTVYLIENKNEDKKFNILKVNKNFNKNWSIQKLTKEEYLNLKSSSKKGFLQKHFMYFKILNQKKFLENKKCFLNQICFDIAKKKEDEITSYLMLHFTFQKTYFLQMILFFLLFLITYLYLNLLILIKK